MAPKHVAGSNPSIAAQLGASGSSVVGGGTPHAPVVATPSKVTKVGSWTITSQLMTPPARGAESLRCTLFPGTPTPSTALVAAAPASAQKLAAPAGRQLSRKSTPDEVEAALLKYTKYKKPDLYAVTMLDDKTIAERALLDCRRLRQKADGRSKPMLPRSYFVKCCARDSFTCLRIAKLNYFLLPKN